MATTMFIHGSQRMLEVLANLADEYLVGPGILGSNNRSYPLCRERSRGGETTPPSETRTTSVRSQALTTTPKVVLSALR